MRKRMRAVVGPLLVGFCGRAKLAGLGASIERPTLAIIVIQASPIIRMTSSWCVRGRAACSQRRARSMHSTVSRSRPVNG